MTHVIENLELSESRKGGYSVETDSLPAATVAYLLQYGFGKSLQDAVASTRSDITKLATACAAGGKAFDKNFAKWQKWAKEYGLPDADYGDAGDVESLVSVAIESDRKARLHAMLAGTVGGHGTGPRLDPVERAMRDIAEEIVSAGAKANKVAMPKGDELAEFVAAVLDAKGDEIRAMAEARIAATKAAAGSAGDLVAAMFRANKS